MSNTTPNNSKNTFVQNFSESEENSMSMQTRWKAAFSHALRDILHELYRLRNTMKRFWLNNGLKKMILE
jgi:hypothetical protein